MREFKVYLEDILESASKIEEYTRGLDYDNFCSNTLVRDAVIRNLLVIGEAVKNLPPEIKNKCPEMEWKKIAGLRDILVHGYFTINSQILWDIITHKLPELKASIKKISRQIK